MEMKNTHKVVKIIPGQDDMMVIFGSKLECDEFVYNSSKNLAVIGLSKEELKEFNFANLYNKTFQSKKRYVNEIVWDNLTKIIYGK